MTQHDNCLYLLRDETFGGKRNDKGVILPPGHANIGVAKFIQYTDQDLLRLNILTEKFVYQTRVVGKVCKTNP